MGGKMLEILKSGGFWIIPIILSAMVATFIIIERLIYYKSIEKNEKCCNNCAQNNWYNPKSTTFKNF